jgi:hypothetical protein
MVVKDIKTIKQIPINFNKFGYNFKSLIVILLILLQSSGSAELTTSILGLVVSN